MNKTEPKNGARRLLVRGLLVAAYAALIGLAFTMGKGHTILLDNKDSEDGSVKAYESMTVSVDGQEAIEFMSGDRDMVKVRAQRHTVVVEVDGKRIEKKITVPVMQDMMLLSIPKLLADKDDALIPFVPKDEPAAPEPEPEPETATDPAAAPLAVPAAPAP